MEKSARVKMGLSFSTVLFCFLILWAEKSSVSADSTELCLASGLFKGISAPVRRSPCGFTLTCLTLQKTIWESQAHTAHSPRQSGDICIYLWEIFRMFIWKEEVPSRNFKDDRKTFCHMAVTSLHVGRVVNSRTLPELCTRDSNWRCNVKRPLLSYFAEEMLLITDKPVTTAVSRLCWPL